MSDTQSLIGRNVEVQGNVIFDGELRVEGKIKGSVISTVAKGALLVIADTGIVEGEVHTPSASISGLVSGSIYTEGLLDLSSTAFVAGDVYYKSLAMAAGARVDGNLVCTAHGSPACTL